MKPFIKRVTLTGADDRVDIHDIYRLAMAYPYSEWGILFSKNNEGPAPRFPTTAWVNSLVAHRPLGMHLSAHICGSWVRDIIAGGTEFMGEKSGILDGIERFQLNFHSRKHYIENPGWFIHALEMLTLTGGQQLIFQWDEVNSHPYQLAGKASGFDAVVLFDSSGGAGILPRVWPAPLGKYCGYAGGLSPENLKEQLAIIGGIVEGKANIWIDMETHIRSDGGQRFDIAKAERVLYAAERYIIQEKG